MLCAHYFASRTKRELVLTEGPALNVGVTMTTAVSGKAEARRLAKQYGAQPWNF